MAGLCMSRYLTGASLLLLGSVICAQQQSKGIPPRSTPADYKGHLTVAGVTYAASLVPADEVKRIFAFDISKSYVVFEVALYPQPNLTSDLNPDGFLARSSQAADPVRRADSITVASVIQQKNIPQPSKTVPVAVSTVVGYESGRDPYTGQRVHGTYTATEVGVGLGDNRIPPPPSPGGYPKDRALLERQLWDRSLPGGRIGQPTAGYLYFPASLLKKAKGSYELEYVGSEPQPVLNGRHSQSAVQLQVPAKNH